MSTRKKTKITLRGQAAKDFLKGVLASKEWPAHLKGSVENMQAELRRQSKKGRRRG